MKCPGCGTRYDDSAFACPKCGRANSGGASIAAPAIPVEPTVAASQSVPAVTAMPDAVPTQATPPAPPGAGPSAATYADWDDDAVAAPHAPARAIDPSEALATLSSPLQQARMLAWASIVGNFVFGAWTFGVGAAIALVLALRARSRALATGQDMPVVVKVAPWLAGLSLVGWAIFWIAIAVGGGQFHFHVGSSTPGSP